MSEKDDVSIGADVDVVSLMKEIRGEVIRKREAGMYPPEVAAEIDDILKRPAERGTTGELRRALSELRRASAFSHLVPTASQRPVAAPAIRTAKRIVRRGMGWYFAAVLDQIRGFAWNVSRALEVLGESLTRTEERISQTESRLAQAERDLSAQVLQTAKSTIDALESRLRRIESQSVGDRLARLDRAVRDLRERLEKGVSPEGAAAPSVPASTVVGSRDVERTLDYLSFENRFRGSVEEISRRQRSYVEFFRGAPGRVLDLGCGRGEFLALLREGNIDSYGIDRHPDMVALCREQSLEVTEADALDHLASLERGSLGGIFCAQTVEHLEPTHIVHFFEMAADAVTPGGRLVVETPNPQSLFIFASAFYVDLGHSRPLHPLTLEFLAQTAGFSETRIEYLSPVPPDFRPRAITRVGEKRLDDLIQNLNENFDRIDSLVFGPQDYALIATR